MEKKSLITWKDAIKLAFGIAVGLLITTICFYCFATCSDNRTRNGSARIVNSNNYGGTYQKRLVVSGVVADDYDTFGNDTIGIFKKNEKYGYYNTKKKSIVIPAKYENAWRFSEGLAGVIMNGKLGFINIKDETVIGFNYGYHESHLYEFVFRWGHCAVPNEKGLCGIIDKNGKWVIKPIYELANVASPNYAIVNVKNGFKIQIDYNGNILNPHVIDEVERLTYTKNIKDVSNEEYIEYPTYYYKYKVNYNVGLMDMNGKIITQPIYHEISALDEKLFSATLNDAVSIVIIDENGNVINN